MYTPPETPSLFGTTVDGQEVHRVTIQGGGLTANVMTYGASIQDLRLDRHPTPLVLGFSEFAPYLTEGRYFGATVGRFANRIANGQFSIDGTLYQLDQNSDDVNTLHGGSAGISQRVWEITDLGSSHVTLVLKDPHLSMGFPGNCEHSCTYALKDNGVLEVTFNTTTDATTVAGLAHHSYFTLDGTGNCLNHLLEIDAGHYLPVDDELIPTGSIQLVDGTAYDFRQAKPIGRDQSETTIYDHNFCLSDRRTGLRKVARVTSEKSGVSLNVSTTEPGLQFYAAHALKTATNGLINEPYHPHAGFCLETQIWPDAPNQPNFPNSILKKDETLKQVTHYQFELA
jgi:aldose 1-epimerase